jgi:hypothetical protein
MATEVAVKKQVELDVEDCARLAAMLDVHVRPVYYKAANGGDLPEFGAEELKRCDRLADLFRDAATTPEVDHDC